MADDKEEKSKVDPDALYCETPGCDFKTTRGASLKAGCTKCHGRAFTDNVRKAEIEAANVKAKAEPVGDVA